MDMRNEEMEKEVGDGPEGAPGKQIGDQVAGRLSKAEWLRRAQGGPAA